MAWKMGEIVLSKKPIMQYERGRYIRFPSMSRFVVIATGGFSFYAVSEEVFLEKLPQILACKRFTKKRAMRIFCGYVCGQTCVDFVSEKVFVEGLKGLI